MKLREAFELGLFLEYINRCPISLPNVQGDRAILQALRETENILRDGGIGKRALKSVSSWREELGQKYPTEGMRIKKADATGMRNHQLMWRSEIRGDLDRKPVLELELESGLDANELMRLAAQEPGKFISAGIWKEMTDIERSDVSDAAKCLLLNTATPSVMVALRGAEASVRNFYYHKTKTDPGEKTWRTLTKELKQKAEPLGIQESFVGYLDYIGAAKRNFAQHPNKIYSLADAVMVFMQVIALVGEVYAQI